MRSDAEPRGGLQKRKRPAVGFLGEVPIGSDDNQKGSRESANSWVSISEEVRLFEKGWKGDDQLFDEQVLLILEPPILGDVNDENMGGVIPAWRQILAIPRNLERVHFFPRVAMVRFYQLWSQSLW
jgi:hypothetical protein